MKFFRSLLAKYMIIVVTAIFLIQIVFVIYALIMFGADYIISPEDSLNPNVIEEKWHDEARKIRNVSEETIQKHFKKWKQQYPDASMFWVDGNGNLRTQFDVKEELPLKWTATSTAHFIKERYGGDPFTVIAFVGKDETQGFIVFEIPRNQLKPPDGQKYGSVLLSLTIGMIFLFILASFLFFKGIRKRLLNLQEAMEVRDVNGLPIQVDVKKNDEIGQLEQTFNQMVFELRESKQREQEEEKLRRELIANLSHDLRTPLTKIRAQTYLIAKEELSEEGNQAIKSMEDSIDHIDRLIENLMSYTLLMASKYKFEPKEIDVVRFVRESIASWYSLFEKEGFEIDVELNPFEKNKWMIDPLWMGRILDNLFQNVLRHAKSGRYIGVKTESTKEYDAFVISDRGKGMKNKSNEKGAGIGLSIVDMMVKGMELDWDMKSSEQGTIIKIKRYKVGRSERTF
ncbi:HAMP domain-containing sensor histidine kinase [Thermaerobacillus caldiproteolyticus]|uniref:HAMP domain-containing sensor histidine kinase n=1 Tax=Thermaerobacillus caldiproteolyticus TaxID=247480 RepID=UPI00188CEE24|nr:HAMP domain-containing sensor histidine kinase [Anoxybacillus caldiproteolyticus]QPA31132.1 HAMP domain-containing histidine kinase [Anoxybacillus caldiproteolyticus]